jgi:hypothetical protein
MRGVAGRMRELQGHRRSPHPSSPSPPSPPSPPLAPTGQRIAAAARALGALSADAARHPLLRGALQGHLGDLGRHLALCPPLTLICTVPLLSHK